MAQLVMVITPSVKSSLQHGHNTVNGSTIKEYQDIIERKENVVFIGCNQIAIMITHDE
jgi:hypothetical protein